MKKLFFLGILTSVLLFSCSKEKEDTIKAIVDEKNNIVTYNDVVFGLSTEDEKYGRFFSFESGKIYKASEIDETNGSTIHLAFGNFSKAMFFFESPTAKGYNIPNATETKIINYEKEPSISVDDFDSMTDDRKLAALTIEGKGDDSFGYSSIPGTVLFEISTGQKGVIKTKSLNSDRLLVDIKIQKN